MDSYLTLIRTKIQQRCGTTRDLLHQIRKTKIGNEAKITPSEFRFILIKFGIMLSQSIVDKVFNIFDTDRSGTMDYDEFGAWIMNQDIIGPQVVEVKEDKESSLRRKLLQSLNNNLGLFATVNHQLSYTEFLAFVSFLPKAYLTEREARAVFLLLTRGKGRDTIDIGQLKRWAHGETETESRQGDTPDIVPSLAAAIKSEFGTNKGIIFQCFEAYVGQGHVLISFEEFRRCLLSQGHGLDVQSAKNLFYAFGGSAGYVDTSVILSSVENAPVLKSHLTDKPRVYNRVNELLREALRKSYKELQREFRSLDPDDSGYVSAEQMHHAINLRCLPLTHHDFRGVLKQVYKQHFSHTVHKVSSQIKADESTNIVNWHSFLMQYSPMKPRAFLPVVNQLPIRPHTTDGVITRKDVKDTNAEDANLPESEEAYPMQESKDDHTGNTPVFIDEKHRMKIPDSAYFRGIWQTALNKCRAADMDREGIVSKEGFLRAINESDTREVIVSPDTAIL